ncbi:MAG: DUF5681 domain-containing protein [Nitrososphaerales archaeon]
MSDQKSDLVAVRDEKTGRFLPGNSGRPVGSKNRITLLKVALEEAFRDEAFDDVQAVLRQVVQQALEGDKSSQRLVWDSAVSKGIQATDKDATDKKGFTVHHMHHDINEEKDDG